MMVIHVLMRDEKEGRKKQVRSNKHTTHPSGVSSYKESRNNIPIYGYMLTYTKYRGSVR